MMKCDVDIASELSLVMYALEVDSSIDGSIPHPVMRMEGARWAPLVAHDHWMIGVMIVMMRMLTRSDDWGAVVKKVGSVTEASIIHLIFILGHWSWARATDWKNICKGFGQIKSIYFLPEPLELLTAKSG